MLLSSALFSTGFSLFTKNKQIYKSFYALSVTQQSDETIAKQIATALQQKGGAGFIDPQNRILISVYPDINSAKSVKNNIKEDYPNTEIIEIKISKPADTEIDYFNEINEEISNLYEIIIEIDKEQISLLQMQEKITKIVENLENLKTETSLHLQGTKKVSYQNFLDRFINLLTSVNNFSNNISNISCSLKYVLTSFIYNFAEFSNFV